MIKVVRLWQCIFLICHMPRRRGMHGNLVQSVEFRGFCDKKYSNSDTADNLLK
jgi:hypothetical protein